MVPPEKKQLMNEANVKATLEKMSGQVIKTIKNIDKLAIIGIRTRGTFLADRISAKIKSMAHIEPAYGILDITLYRDDLTAIGPQPVVHETRIPFSLTGKTVLLVDDVFYTGRTMRAALDEIMDFGRPALVQIAVLVDRGHHELPIRPDYIGKCIKTTREEFVEVQLDEVDGKEQVIKIEKQAK